MPNANSPQMSTDELYEFLGIANEPRREKILASFSPEKIATIEAMKRACEDIEIWQNGGPRPQGIILCHDHAKRSGEGK